MKITITEIWFVAVMMFGSRMVLTGILSQWDTLRCHLRVAGIINILAAIGFVFATINRIRS